MIVREFSLFLPGKPPPRQEPSLQLGMRKGAAAGLPKGAVWRAHVFPAMYPNEATEAGMARWRRAWLDHPQRPYCPGPIALELTAWRARAQNHLRVDGTLSSEGERWPHPSMRPDLDNLEKLAADALKERAIDDDSCIVEKHSWKRWATRENPEGILLKVWSVVPNLGIEPLFQ